jgi:hypothetical protein
MQHSLNSQAAHFPSTGLSILSSCCKAKRLLSASLLPVMFASLSACGGSDSSLPPVVAAVGPTRAAACPSALPAVVLSCPTGTPVTTAQLTAIIGTYNNGSANLADQLFVSNRGTVYYGSSPTEYTPVTYCQVGSDALLSFAGTNRIAFTISSTAVVANGNAPTSPATPVNAAAQSSCQF